ncbi:MAG TPA: TadE/TadG family type IV pilus assembly protein [Sphingomonadaceae bacterium]|nr:TadE/TadG family type IV pilus assembly protein [Sphingomonadaceae bacterium]
MATTERQRHLQRALVSSHRGASAVEFALVAPLFLLMLLGILGYGGYFWRAHALQQVANDAARAAIAGLTAPERADLARATVAAEIGRLAGLAPARAITTVAESNDAILVTVAYDARQDIFFHLPLVPMPAPLIERIAAVRLGGF